MISKDLWMDLVSLLQVGWNFTYEWACADCTNRSMISTEAECFKERGIEEDPGKRL